MVVVVLMVDSGGGISRISRIQTHFKIRPVDGGAATCVNNKPVILASSLSLLYKKHSKRN